MVPTLQAGVTDPAPAPRPRGRPRKVQPEIDPSLPLHPWATSASTSRLGASTSYVAPSSQPHQPVRYTSATPQPQLRTMVAPVPAPVFYAQQQAQPPNYTHTRAVAAPTSEVRAVASTPAPMLPPKKTGPTRADLDFLLGGVSRARSATPQVSRASAAPTRSLQQHLSSTHAFAAGQAVAGPSHVSMQSAAPSVAPPSAAAAANGQEAVDDGLALGAEAIMESDHNASSPLSSASANDDDVAAALDDPNDGDFRPRPYVRRSLPGDTSAGTRRRGRPSVAASSSAGKVAGSTSSNPTRKRGRPKKVEYTPDVMERMRVANEILSSAEADLEAGKRVRLDDIIDRKTRQALSPEMQQVILKARNTQLQRVRREKLRQAAAAAEEAKATGGGVVMVENKKKRGRPSLASKKQLHVQTDERGEAIVERAKGKVSEWIKTISSEPEPEHVDKGASQPSRSTNAHVDVEVDRAPAIQPQLEPDDADAYFTHFGTVTGQPPSATADGTAKPFQATTVDDEYYFSN